MSDTRIIVLALVVVLVLAFGSTIFCQLTKRRKPSASTRVGAGKVVRLSAGGASVSFALVEVKIGSVLASVSFRPDKTEAEGGLLARSWDERWFSVPETGLPLVLSRHHVLRVTQADTKGVFVDLVYDPPTEPGWDFAGPNV